MGKPKLDRQEDVRMEIIPGSGDLGGHLGTTERRAGTALRQGCRALCMTYLIFGIRPGLFHGKCRLAIRKYMPGVCIQRVPPEKTKRLSTGGPPPSPP